MKLFRSGYLIAGIGFFVLFLTSAPLATAQQGCCSWHGGIDYCGASGYYMCNDGTRSPTCTCEYEKLVDQAVENNLRKLHEIQNLIYTYGPSSVCTLIPALRDNELTLINAGSNTLDELKANELRTGFPCGIACIDLDGAIIQYQLFLKFINDLEKENCLINVPTVKSTPPQNTSVKKSTTKTVKKKKQENNISVSVSSKAGCPANSKLDKTKNICVCRSGYKMDSKRKNCLLTIGQSNVISCTGSKGCQCPIGYRQASDKKQCIR